ncbi:hypothetical protein [Urbifossiella limnaea]|uniref:Uncharacterized protein n=1 Tax=Urbifossiella limnaea TaxID=2528023 RepID=A0A517XY52_9BACT|nr:hypothetical protein [Urbifossiella limnaea]QDU22460.1 hypothetical protein ETAA1_44400 [Urbifossiella limnaea]
MAHWLYLPDDAVEDLAILARMSADQIGSLRKHFDDNEYAHRSSYYTAVADLLAISDDAAAGLCSLINSVQSQRTRQGREAESVPGEFLQFLKRLPKNKESQEELVRIANFITDNRSLIVELFSDFPNRDYSDKLRGLETGPLPHLHSFRTVCDLRPVYNADATDIVTYLPLVTMCMTIHKSMSDDFEEVSVLLSEDDIDDIRDALDRLDQKLSLLKHRHQLDAPKNGEG